MRLELEIDPGSSDTDLLAEVIADPNLTEYGIPLENMQSMVLDHDGLWEESEGDLINASRLARGATFSLTRWDDEGAPSRLLFRNGRVTRLVAVVSWVPE